MRRRLLEGAAVVLGVCIGARVAAAILAPLWPVIVVLACVVGLLLWLLRR